MSPLLMLIVFPILFAVILMAIGLAFRFFESERKKQVAGMLNSVTGEALQETQSALLVDRTLDENPFETLLNRTSIPPRAGRIIQQAAIGWTVGGLVGMTMILGVAGGILGLVLHPLGFVLVNFLAPAVLFGSLPYLYLRFKRNQRLAEIESQLPEALDFLARSMRAGHAFSVSLELLGTESPDPLGQEFRVLFNEQNLGAPLQTAMTNLIDRVPLLDMRLFVSSVMLQKQTGGNLSEILIRLAYIIRERFRLRGQVKAASAHGRMTAVVLMLLPAVLMVALLIIAPGYLQGMANDPDGKWMIIGAIAAQILGYFVMKKITNIKV
jgi:tight adherence protein B